MNKSLYIALALTGTLLAASCDLFEKKADVKILVEIGTDSTAQRDIGKSVQEVMKRIIKCFGTDPHAVFLAGDKRKFQITINAFGSDSASIARLENVIGFSGNGLEFLETCHFDEIAQNLVDLDQWLRQHRPKETPKTKIHTEKLQNQLDSLLAASDTLITDSIDKAVLFPLIIPNVDEDRRPLPHTSCLGFVLAKDTARVAAFLRTGADFFPSRVKFFWSFRPVRSVNAAWEGARYELHAINTPHTGEAFITGADIEEAVIKNSRFMGSPAIQILMKKFGKSKWEQMTRENKHRCIAIMIGRNVASAPYVDETIHDGSAKVSGDYTREELKSMLDLLFLERLKAPVKIIAVNIL